MLASINITDDLSKAITTALNQVANFIPKLIGFIVVFFIGLIVTLVITKVLTKILQKVNFDRHVHKGFIGDAMGRSGSSASELIVKIIKYFMLLFVLQFSLNALGKNPISDLINKVISYLPHLFVAIAIIVIASAIGAAVKDLVMSTMGGVSYGPTLAKGASMAILVIAGFAALSALQVAPSIVNSMFIALLAVIAGSAVVAIGGGGITPMRGRWERALGRLDEESAAMKQRRDTQELQRPRQ